MDLAWVLHPISVEQFLATYWEERHLHVTGRASGYFSSLFSMRDLDHAIGNVTRGIKLVRSGVTMGPPEPQRPPTISELYDAFYGGATLVVHGLDKRWKPVAQLARALSGYFGCEISANLYATPRNASGFKCHYDDHDVFVLQVAGQKTWHLHDLGPTLPRAEPDNRVQVFDQPGEPMESVTLKEGDVLYLPRGVAHRAETEDRSSAHLTVGLHLNTWEHLLVEAIRDLASRNIAFRRALPPGSLLADGVAHLGEGMQELLASALPELSAANARAALGQKVLAMAPAITDGHFAQLDDVDRITPDTQLEKRDHSIFLQTSANGAASLAFPGYVQTGPAKLAEAFAFITSQDRFRVSAIPGPYTDRERVTITRHLVRKGFLRIVSE